VCSSDLKLSKYLKKQIKKIRTSQGRMIFKYFRPAFYFSR